MSKLNIKMFPVNSGDCFFVKCKGNKTTNILIDCGYKGTVESVIKELKALISNGGECK